MTTPACPSYAGHRFPAEITAVPRLLAMVSLRDTIVTVDALNCQRATAQRVIEQGGDDVVALKGNQGSLHADVQLYLDDPVHQAELSHQRTVDDDHGRIRFRIGRQSPHLLLAQAASALLPPETALRRELEEPVGAACWSSPVFQFRVEDRTK